MDVGETLLPDLGVAIIAFPIVRPPGLVERPQKYASWLQLRSAPESLGVLVLLSGVCLVKRHDDRLACVCVVLFRDVSSDCLAVYCSILLIGDTKVR